MVSVVLTPLTIFRFVKYIAFIIALLISSDAISQDRPNIIFFFADDQRHDTLGCAGHPIVETPTIDKLAEEGVRFTNMFVTRSTLLGKSHHDPDGIDLAFLGQR